ncbi:MAG TPA: hypothetical protein VF183_07415 [Acidimicrobiales bacterium]
MSAQTFAITESIAPAHRRGDVVAEDLVGADEVARLLHACSVGGHNVGVVHHALTAEHPRRDERAERVGVGRDANVPPVATRRLEPEELVATREDLDPRVRVVQVHEDHDVAWLRTVPVEDGGEIGTLNDRFPRPPVAVLREELALGHSAPP